MALVDERLRDLLAAIGAATPSPASGAALGLAGALAAACAELAARVSGDAAAGDAAGALGSRLADLADADAAAFSGWLATRAPEQREATIETPLATAEAAAELAVLARGLAVSGKPSVRGDAEVAALLAAAAARGAARLVELNARDEGDPRVGRARTASVRAAGCPQEPGERL